MNQINSLTAPVNATGYSPMITDPLATAGVIVRYASGYVPVVGSFLSTMISLLWPQNKEDVWTQSEQLHLLINEFQDKSRDFTASLKAKNYNYARDIYISLTGFFIGVEKKFMIAGKKTSYSFAPLYCATVCLILAFRKEVIDHAAVLKLSGDEIASEKQNLKNLLSDAISYMKKVESAHNSTLDLTLHLSFDSTTINSLFLKDWYYKTQAIIFIQIWDNQLSEDPTKPINLSFPCLATGIFKIRNPNGYQADAVSGYNLASWLTSSSDQSKIAEVNLYDTVEYSASNIRPTAIELTYVDNHTERHGYFGAPHDLQVTAHPLKCAVAAGDYLTTAEASTVGFVHQIKLATAAGNSVTVGHSQGDSKTTTVTLTTPYRIAKFYLPPDEVGYYYCRSGHQVIGFACGGVYDNELAAEYAKSILNGTTH